MNWKECPLTVLKFGGSSVADAERMRHVAQVIKKVRNSGYRVAVVVSAMGNMTDDLLELAGSVSEYKNGREIDRLLATGEQQSVALLALALQNSDIPAQSFTSRQAGIFAKGFPMEGRIKRIDPSAVEKVLDEGIVAVITGFQAVTGEGDIITLGRGGSDLSAVALAAALEAESCQLLKDVAGIMTCDPKIVKNAQKIDEISFDECMEMAVQGANVIQARSVEVAARYDVPLYVGSSFTEEEGTWVMSRPVTEGLIIKAVTVDTKITKVVLHGVPDVPGVAAKLFTNLADNGVGTEMILQNNMRGGVNDIGFLVKKEHLETAIKVCRDLCHEIDAQGVSYDTEIARVTIIGAGIANHPEVPSKMFNVLAKENINIEMIASTALALTCVVDSKRSDEAARVLHNAFIGEEAV
ncbi:MAG: aspartate kinase [Synergistaceae bacterium]|jgi:aspartate kinase|nr:aspartate kinase [Synergistaceae bacterium]